MKVSREQLRFDFDAPDAVPPYRIVCDDVLAWAETYAGPPFHAMLTDAPYELGFMGREWDRSGIAFKPDTWKALAQHLLPGAFGMCFASSRGWHRLACAIEDAGLRIFPSIFGWGFSQGFPKASRIDRQVDANAPRQHLFAAFANHYAAQRHASGFSHHEICAIGGFYHEVNHGGASSNWELGATVPTLAQWIVLKLLLNLSDEFLPLIERMEAERAVIGKGDAGLGKGHPAHNGGYKPEYDLTAPATPLAQAWAGHRYGLQALKPALEPIIVFQKPYQGKPVQSITQTGAGALWIDGGRLRTPETLGRLNHARPKAHCVPDSDPYAKPFGRLQQHDAFIDNTRGQGRWPAHFCLVHTDQCVRVGTRQVQGARWSDTDDLPIAGLGWGMTTCGQHYTDATGHETVDAWDCAPGCPVQALDLQAGERKSGGRAHVRGDAIHDHWRQMEEHLDERYRAADYQRDASTGHASRFFFTADWSLDLAERLAQADPVFYCAKASRAEQDRGLEDRALQSCDRRGSSGCHRTLPRCPTHNMYLPSGSSVYQCGCPITFDEQPNTPMERKNTHPTVKPLALCQWLATLLLPPAAYAPRRVLIPFAGTGSEALGALRAGWDEVLLIERDATYAEMAQRRLAAWR